MLHSKKIKLVGSIFIGIFLLLAIIPATKYIIPSFVVKKQIQVRIQDAQGRPAGNAAIIVKGDLYTADQNGFVTLKRLPVGNYEIKASSTFYETAEHTVLIPLFRQPKVQTITLRTVGEITYVQIKNRISGRGLGGIKITSQVAGNGVTNDEGIAIISIPKGSTQSDAKITGDTVNDQSITIKAGGAAADNTFFATPKGRIAYVRSGQKLQVVTSNLDGTNEQVALDGTGNEDVLDTQLLSSPSQKFAALKSRRDGAAALYIVNLENSQIATVESTGASYIPVGWRNDVFVYVIYTKQAVWQPGAYVLKAYNALNNQTTLLDSSRAEGVSVLDYASEVFENIYILPEGIVYAKKWQSSYYYGARLADKRMTITVAQPDGTKTNVSEWQAGYNATIKTKQVAPKELSVFVELDGVKRSYYKYSDIQVKQYGEAGEDVFKDPTLTKYYSSPNNLFSTWYDNVLSRNFIATIKNTATAPLDLPSSYKVVGWYGSDYILLLDTISNELKITSRDSAQKSGNTLKIAEVYVPQQSYTAAGYGR